MSSNVQCCVRLAIAVSAGLLSACSETVEQSSEAFSTMADVHNNPDVIESTLNIDRLLIEQDPEGNWSASVFDSDTALLERGALVGELSAETETPLPDHKRMDLALIISKAALFQHHSSLVCKQTLRPTYRIRLVLLGSTFLVLILSSPEISIRAGCCACSSNADSRTISAFDSAFLRLLSSGCCF